MDAIARYLTLHADNLVGAVGRVAERPLGSLMTILVIAIALVVPAGLRVMVDNARALSGTWEGVADFTVYLEMAVDEETAEMLAQRVAQRPDVDQAELVTRSDALEDFRAYSGFGEALDLLDDNPLPHALVVRPAGTGANLETLVADLDSLEETGCSWIRRGLNGCAPYWSGAPGRGRDHRCSARSSPWRLEIGNRREEIEIVTAPAGYIRRPFLYLPLLRGGRGRACGVDGPGAGARRRAGPGTDGTANYRLAGLGVGDTALLLGIGAFLGLNGMWSLADTAPGTFPAPMAQWARPRAAVHVLIRQVAGRVRVRELKCMLSTSFRVSFKSPSSE